MAEKTESTNIMGAYVSNDTAPGQIFLGIREGFEKGVAKRFNAAQLNRAAEYMAAVRKSIDAPTHRINQDLYYTLNGEDAEEPRIYMLLKGRLNGKSDSQKTYSLLEVPHHKAQKKVNDETIDDFLTNSTAADFIHGLNGGKEYFETLGFDKFETLSSMFFYFNPKNIADFSSGGEVDTTSLLSFVVPYSQGYDILTGNGLVEMGKNPKKAEYLEMVPPYVSSRLKLDLTSKILKKASRIATPVLRYFDENGNLVEQNMIRDWAGHRIQFSDYESVQEFQEMLSKGIFRIGKSRGKGKIEKTYEKDYYKNPKGESDFADVTVAAMFDEKGFEKTYRELKLVDADRQRRNEFRTGRGSHEDLKKRREGHWPREFNGIRPHYESVLEKVLRTKKQKFEIRL